MKVGFDHRDEYSCAAGFVHYRESTTITHHNRGPTE
jgi:hypothetical protein